MVGAAGAPPATRPRVSALRLSEGEETESLSPPRARRAADRGALPVQFKCRGSGKERRGDELEYKAG